MSRDPVASPPMKPCPSCRMANLPLAQRCKACGHVFWTKRSTHRPHAPGPVLLPKIVSLAALLVLTFGVWVLIQPGDASHDPEPAASMSASLAASLAANAAASGSAAATTAATTASTPASPTTTPAGTPTPRATAGPTTAPTVRPTAAPTARPTPAPAASPTPMPALPAVSALTSGDLAGWSVTADHAITAVTVTLPTLSAYACGSATGNRVFEDWMLLDIATTGGTHIRLASGAGCRGGTRVGGATIGRDAETPLSFPAGTPATITVSGATLTASAGGVTRTFKVKGNVNALLMGYAAGLDCGPFATYAVTGLSVTMAGATSGLTGAGLHASRLGPRTWSGGRVTAGALMGGGRAFTVTRSAS